MFSFANSMPPAFVPVYLYIFIVLGALALELLSIRQDFQGARRWLRRTFPNSNRIEIMNFVIVITLGPIIAAFFIQPQTEPQAIAAGLGWVGLVNTIALPDKEMDN